MQIQARARLPAKVEPLFRPAPYKVLYGGRGAMKSWSIARALLMQSVEQPLRVLCTRENQSSIRESVHHLLASQIDALGLGAVFRIEQQGITGLNGTQFAFAGLSDQTAESLKSYERFNRVWVEEAQVVTERSWQILLPTIARNPGAEVWVSFNPELDTDPTWKRFVGAPPDGAVVIEMGWRDNPWMSGEMHALRRRDEETLPPEEYAWIWEGRCRPAISGAIYSGEIAAMEREGRITDVPYDAFHRVHPVWDLGWNDATVILLCQRHLSGLRIIDYLEADHQTLEWYSRQLRERAYSYGTLILPHDGDHGDIRTGRSARQTLESHGWQVHVLDSTPIETGIRAARMTLGQTVIDRRRCAPLIEHLRRYRRAIPRTTGEPGSPVHDQHSHAADAFRYAAMALPEMQDEGMAVLPPLQYPRAAIV